MTGPGETFRKLMAEQQQDAVRMSVGHDREEQTIILRFPDAIEVHLAPDQAAGLVQMVRKHLLALGC